MNFFGGQNRDFLTCSGTQKMEQEGKDASVLKSVMNRSFILNCWSITILLTKGSQKSALLICTISHFARVGEGFLCLLSGFGSIILYVIYG